MMMTVFLLSKSWFIILFITLFIRLYQLSLLVSRRLQPCSIVICELGIDSLILILLIVTVISFFLWTFILLHLIILLLIITVRHNLFLRNIRPGLLLCSFLCSSLLPGARFFLRVPLCQLQLLLPGKAGRLLLLCFPPRTGLHLLRGLRREVPLPTHYQAWLGFS